MSDSLQTDLLGAASAPAPSSAPAVATAPGVAQLKVTARGAGKLSPAQQRFNKLLARVDNLGRQVQNIQRLTDAVRAPHLERVSSLERRITQTQTEMAVFLHERLQRKGLTAAQQKSVRRIVMLLLEMLEPESDDSPLVALHSVYFSAQDQTQALQDAKRQVVEAVEAVLGRPIDLEGLDDMASPEELLAAVMRKVHGEQQAQAQAQEQAQEQAQAQRHPASKAKRPTTARQRKAEEEAQDAKSAMRTIYRQLASALHPDREPDLAERERKSALMSQANAAYERGDLVTLLRLQLQAQQVDEAHISRLADDKLAALSRLLKEQVAALEGEVFEAEMRASAQLGIEVSATMDEKMLGRRLLAAQEDAEHTARIMQADLERVRDDVGLKLWLREQNALAKQQERQDALLAQFGGYF